MKQTLRKLFAPILSPFESGDEPYAYKPLNRKVLIVIGVLFSGLATIIVVVAGGLDWGYIFPAIIFYGVGLVALVIGLVGDDRAVAKIWGGR